MGFIERLERNIAKLEKKIEKEEQKIAQLEAKCDGKKITKAEFNIKRKRHDDQIHAWSSRIRVLQGGIVREKQHIEEKEEEKEKKEEKKRKKKKEKGRTRTNQKNLKKRKRTRRNNIRRTFLLNCFIDYFFHHCFMLTVEYV
jgi:chromosome segregation ATPase